MNFAPGGISEPGGYKRTWRAGSGVAVRPLIEWAVTILGLVLAVLWLVLVTVTKTPVPDWLPPSAVALLAVAIALP